MSWCVYVDATIDEIEWDIRDRLIEPEQAVNELSGIRRLLVNSRRKKFAVEIERLDLLIAHYEGWAETTAELMSA